MKNPEILYNFKIIRNQDDPIDPGELDPGEFGDDQGNPTATSSRLFNRVNKKI